MSKLNSEVRLYVTDNEIQSSVSVASALHNSRRVIDGENVLDAVIDAVIDAVDTLKAATSFTDRWETVPYTFCDVFIYGDVHIPTETVDRIADELRLVRLIHEVRFYFRKNGGDFR